MHVYTDRQTDRQTQTHTDTHTHTHTHTHKHICTTRPQLQPQQILESMPRLLPHRLAKFSFGLRLDQTALHLSQKNIVAQTDVNVLNIKRSWFFVCSTFPCSEEPLTAEA